MVNVFEPEENQIRGIALASTRGVEIFCHESEAYYRQTNLP